MSSTKAHSKGSGANEQNPAAHNPLGLARLEMKKGALTHTHHHEAECLLVVLEGTCKVYLQDQIVTVGRSETLRIPPQCTHVAEALADAILLSISTSTSEWSGCGPLVQHDADQYLWGV